MEIVKNHRNERKYLWNKERPIKYGIKEYGPYKNNNKT